MPSIELPPIPPVVREPWKATWWVSFLQSLSRPFPQVDSSEDEWKQFLLRCFTWPAVILGLGFAVALMVLLWSCCCGSRARRRIRTAPSRMPSFCVGLVTFMIIASGTFLYFGTGFHAIGTAQDTIASLESDLTTVSDNGVLLANVSDSLSRNIGSIPSSCPASVRKQVEAQVKNLQQEVKRFQSEIDDFNSQVKPLPNLVEDVKEHAPIIAHITLAGGLAPMALVLLCCLATLAAVCFSFSGRFTGCCLRTIGPLMMVPAIVIIAVAAAVELEVGIVSSSFCKNVDSNALAVIQYYTGANSTAYQLSAFYIEGRGSNPLME
eukprot:TRINITY_DN28020_c0_g1_i1.p1 TRINITY_DN28020_c0_g1~~TRINITY_DN28020_c0_g1_i1.p1  ORF type:complete len:322 (-),score=43.76 TRINITY_DN28020_c0_g1_i1:600-1565(-)